MAVAEVESGFDKLAVSPKRAMGIMQVLPATAKLYGIDSRELFNENTNIKVGIYYLKHLLKIFNNKDLAIAAYNCGPTRVIEAGYSIPNISETINYVRRVNNAARRYRQSIF